MIIEAANEHDYEYIIERDKHILERLVLQKILNKEIYVIRDSDKHIGWMRYSYFWDNTPFMNMLWIDEPYRNSGIGTKIVLDWEKLMQANGVKLVMTSTQANEQAQHFYRKLGYKDAGCLLLEDEPLEIILTKQI